MLKFIDNPYLDQEIATLIVLLVYFVLRFSSNKLVRKYATLNEVFIFIVSFLSVLKVTGYFFFYHIIHLYFRQYFLRFFISVFLNSVTGYSLFPCFFEIFLLYWIKKLKRFVTVQYLHSYKQKCI